MRVHRHTCVQASQEYCWALPYYDGPLMAVMLLHDGVVPSQEAVGALNEVRANNVVGLGDEGLWDKGRNPKPQTICKLWP